MLVSTCRVELLPDIHRGYVLHITNLEDQFLDYLVTFVVTVHTGLLSGSPNPSELDRFARISGDNYSVEQPFRRMVGGGGFLSSTFTYSAIARCYVAPRRTSAIGIEPPPFLTGLGAAIAGISGRRQFSFDRLEGYVTIRVPPIRSQEKRFLTRPQAQGPVRVLLNPETHAIYRVGGGQATNYDDPPPYNDPLSGLVTGNSTVDPPPVQRGFSYLPSRMVERTEPLHLASGKAENELIPEGSRLITADGVKYALDALTIEEGKETDYRGADLVADQDRAGALIELLGEVGSNDTLIRALNQVLKEQKAGVSLTKLKT